MVERIPPANAEERNNFKSWVKHWRIELNMDELMGLKARLKMLLKITEETKAIPQEFFETEDMPVSDPKRETGEYRVVSVQKSWEEGKRLANEIWKTSIKA